MSATDYSPLNQGSRNVSPRLYSGRGQALNTKDGVYATAPVHLRPEVDKPIEQQDPRRRKLQYLDAVLNALEEINLNVANQQQVVDSTGRRRTYDNVRLLAGVRLADSEAGRRTYLVLRKLGISEFNLNFSSVTKLIEIVWERQNELLRLPVRDSRIFTRSKRSEEFKQKQSERMKKLHADGNGPKRKKATNETELRRLLTNYGSVIDAT